MAKMHLCPQCGREVSWAWWMPGWGICASCLDRELESERGTMYEDDVVQLFKRRKAKGGRDLLSLD